MRSNTTMEIDNGDRPLFPNKRRPPLVEEEKKYETMGLPYQRVGGPNGP